MRFVMKKYLILISILMFLGCSDACYTGVDEELVKTDDGSAEEANVDFCK